MTVPTIACASQGRRSSDWITLAHRAMLRKLLLAGASVGLFSLLLAGVTAGLHAPIHVDDHRREPIVSDALGERNGPQYDVGGRITWRERADGQVEFCFEPAGQAMVCPTLRFTNPRSLRTDAWTRSSPIALKWRVNPERVTHPPSIEATAASCDADLERMFAATWKVETLRARGTAFHIGAGRFVTAHHVIQGAPPIVALVHNERSVPAAVLGSNAEHDVALLQAFNPLDVLDVPAARFRNPTADDIGGSVYLVGYPSAGALTASTGVVTRVYRDEIRTNSSARGGNSGGPMFDLCGDVLGVIWAGSSAENHSHSGEVLRLVLEALSQAPQPQIPPVPDGLKIPNDVVLWHYGPDPPEDVDCSDAAGEWWVGVAGAAWERIDWVEPYAGQCGSGDVAVIGFRKAPHTARDGVTCKSQYGPRHPVVTSVLHESSETFGQTRLGTLGALAWCPDHFTHELEIRLTRPTDQETLRADLIGVDGSVLRGRDRGTVYQLDNESNRYTGLKQPWRVPAGFEPVAFRLHLGDVRFLVEIQAPGRGAELDQQARIVVRGNPDGVEPLTCLQLGDGEIACPSGVSPQTGPNASGWRHSAPLIWSVSVDSATKPWSSSCALSGELGTLAWQMSALGKDGSALYVGGRQFITASRLFTDETPWGVVSQGELSLPVARVATDARNGLALVEVLGDSDLLDRYHPPAIAHSTEGAVDSQPVLVAYPWGESDRFAMTRLRVQEVTDRLMWHNGWGWDRAGAPVVDPCTRSVIGISYGSNSALRSEVVSAALRELRRLRVSVPVLNQGPTLYGSIALLPQPIYLGTKQPHFGGWICNVRESARYEVFYAVYLVSRASSDLMGVVNGQQSRPSRCGGSGKIFIVEYRSDQVPSAICAEPYSPRSPHTTLDLELVAVSGVELVQAINFARPPCPALLDSSKWASTHLMKLRFSEQFEPNDIEVLLEDANGNRHQSTERRADIDPDVWDWRFNLQGMEPAKLIVARHGQESDAASEEIDAAGKDPDSTCTEDTWPDSESSIDATLHSAQISIGHVRVVRYDAPITCLRIPRFGVVLTFTEPVSHYTHLDAALIGADASVYDGRLSGVRYFFDPVTELYTSYRKAFEVPGDITPIAVEVRLGERRWIIALNDQ